MLSRRLPRSAHIATAFLREEGKILQRAARNLAFAFFGREW
jgi:hypothetical protein